MATYGSFPLEASTLGRQKAETDVQSHLFAESARATITAVPGFGAPTPLPLRRAAAQIALEHRSRTPELDLGTLQGVLGVQARAKKIHGQ
ncbi:hypothetical protein HO133_006592 [Letharia lupina]|uniref:Uncharacterized protein n=1 Tax=Letharia lupina TaxID=560253 RepID=A0A8H6C6G9_9LECA|nr:uncharacterized protein HO133_006592 [Letharia lupina]KAF6217765.1 hypothetical protein HO133_006592 [Letharia lupina]